SLSARPLTSPPQHTLRFGRSGHKATLKPLHPCVEVLAGDHELCPRSRSATLCSEPKPRARKMNFDIHAMHPTDRYELLTGTILPRPITIVTTLSVDGALNAAPYSLFNVVSHDPPVLMIAILPHPEGRLKDTAVNIFATREFVVNLVPRSM